MTEKPTHEELEQKALNLERVEFERKKAEDSLQKSRVLLNETGRIAKVGGWEFDVDTQEQVWTEEVYLIHEVDMTYKPTVSKGIDFYAPTSRPIIEQAVQRAIEYGEPFDVELEFITAKGNHRWVHAIGKVHQEHGKVKKVFGVVQDVTERKRIEEIIIQARDEWERTFHAVPDLLAILDDKFRIVRVNKAMADTLGLAPDEAVGLLCYENIHGTTEPPPFCPHAKLLLDGQAHTVEIHEEGLGGDFFVSVSPRYDSSGRLIGSVHVAHDITAKKQAEAELQKAHDELEQKVYKRTQELSITNEKMHQEIKERRLVEETLNKKEKELKHQADRLEKINTALKVLLEHRDEERRRLEEGVFLNVKKLIIPYLDKLVIGVPNSHAKTYLDIIKTNLENLVTPFASKLSSKHLNLTPTEMQVADFIRNGHTTKEIASHLDVSVEAVSFHRKNIRKKLGLTKRKTNLRSYLQRLSD